MEELIDFIEKLEGESFGGWSEKEKNAYLTACTSIKVKAKTIQEDLKKELIGVLPDCDTLLKSTFERFTNKYYFDFERIVECKFARKNTLKLLQVFNNWDLFPFVDVFMSKDKVILDFNDARDSHLLFRVYISKEFYNTSLCCKEQEELIDVIETMDCTIEQLESILEDLTLNINLEYE